MRKLDGSTWLGRIIGHVSGKNPGNRPAPSTLDRYLTSDGQYHYRQMYVTCETNEQGDKQHKATARMTINDDVIMFDSDEARQLETDIEYASRKSKSPAMFYENLERSIDDFLKQSGTNLNQAQKLEMSKMLNMAANECYISKGIHFGFEAASPSVPPQD